MWRKGNPLALLVGMQTGAATLENSMEVPHINNSQTKERAQMSSTDEWIKKMWFIYTMEYYSAIKKNKILAFATTCMELRCIMLNEINQSEKDKYHMISLMWNLRNKTDEHRG